MNILAIDTATERCSAALLLGEHCLERAQDTARTHAQLILPMIDALLQESGSSLQALDGIAYGRGPGSFTGVRIAVAVAQGLAYGAQRLTVGISDLAAVAEQAARESGRPGDRLLVCMDARMGEVYWAEFEFLRQRSESTPLTIALGPERVSAPEVVIGAASGTARVFAGTGFKAYPQLQQLAGGAEHGSERAPAAGPDGSLTEPLEQAAPDPSQWHERDRAPGRAIADSAQVHPDMLPHAREVALLARAELLAGRGRPPAEAQPVYLRDQVAWPRQT